MINSKQKKIIARALLCLLFLVYLIYHIASSFSPKTQLFTVTRVTEPHTLNVTGYIFRDETLIYSGSGGICTYTRENGEKVAVNSVIANSYFIENSEIEKKLTELDYKIEVLENSIVSESEELTAVDSRIANIRAEIVQKTACGNTAFVQNAEKELLVLLHQRALIEKNNSNYNAKLTELRAEQTMMVASLAAVSSTVTTAESGYFYSFTDGYENIFTAQAAKELTIETFDLLTKTSPAVTYSASGKIATSFKWYFVCKTTTEASEEITADKYYNITFTDNSHDSSLELFAEKKLIDHNTGEAVLVFSCTSVPKDFDFSRVQRAEIAFSETSGLRVPSAQIRVIDGKTCVYIMRKGVCRIREVDIIFEKDGYCIVSETQKSGYISAYDRIVLGDNDLYDGKVIGYD